MNRDSRDTASMTFWEHLDAFRSVLFRLAIAVVGIGLVAFFFKDQLFDAVLAPKNPDFITYRIISRASALAGLDIPFHPAPTELINTGLARQFAVHVQVALYAGLLLASPYVLYILFGFISPALYESERRMAVSVCGGGYLMFLLGMAVSYFAIFPMTFQFLAYYQVNSSVTNMITLDSYIETLLMMSIMMGLMFELPVICSIASRLGLLTSETMRRYRRHALVGVLVVGAVITPTGDALTLSVVAVPVYLLYEMSIFIVRRGERHHSGNEEESQALPA